MELDATRRGCGTPRRVRLSSVGGFQTSPKRNAKLPGPRTAETKGRKWFRRPLGRNWNSGFSRRLEILAAHFREVQGAKSFPRLNFGIGSFNMVSAFPGRNRDSGFSRFGELSCGKRRSVAAVEVHSAFRFGASQEAQHPKPRQSGPQERPEKATQRFLGGDPPPAPCRETPTSIPGREAHCSSVPECAARVRAALPAESRFPEERFMSESREAFMWRRIS